MKASLTYGRLLRSRSCSGRTAGKSNDWVNPTITRSPSGAIAIAAALSLSRPPRYVARSISCPPAA